MACSPLSHADTYAPAIIKVHSPHSFLSFFFDQSKDRSRGPFAFPFPYPQADTKVPSETEHKHSEVAVTQGRFVGNSGSCALPARLREARVQRSKRVPQQRPNSSGENPNAPRNERAGPHGRWPLDGPGMLTCELKWRLFVAGGGG